MGILEDLKPVVTYLGEWLLSNFPGRNKPSPKARINEGFVSYIPSSQTLLVRNLQPEIWIAGVGPTLSMDPIVDVDSKVILQSIKDINDLQVGDIIVYERSKDNLIIHQIIKIGQDEKGWWCIPKGINNAWRDGIVRAEQIKWVMVGVLY